MGPKAYRFIGITSHLWIAGGRQVAKKWVSEKKKEHYYRQAKKTGYRARSAFKLKQINSKHNVISAGNTVIDLGCAPGGWLQVASELVGEEGSVVGVDLTGIEPIDGVIFIRGDARQQETRRKILDAAGRADVVISDMSPNITGHYSMDHARSVDLAEMALEIACSTLKNGGNFVVKVFQGDMFKDYFDSVKSRFRFVKGHSPAASRKSSSEIYIVAKGYLGRKVQ